MKLRAVTAAATLATALVGTAVTAAPAHADTWYHACRIVNGTETYGPLPFGWAADPCVYLDYDTHDAVAEIYYKGGTTDVHLVAEIGYEDDNGGIAWGQGRYIDPNATRPVRSGSVREFSYSVHIPDSWGGRRVYARARLTESSVGMVGDVESNPVPTSW
jgi:hypothetical protein